MKNIFTSCLLLMSLSVFAQEAGRAGELLKNEAKTTEMQTQRNDNAGRGNDKILDNSNYRKPSQSNNPKGYNTTNYRWNYNYGNAEVFVRIPQNGNYTIEIGDQMMSNSTGKFRFFDLKFGTVPISIYENNYLIYRTNLRVKSYTRMVLDFFPDYGLYLLGNYPVQNNAYGINEWDDIWNNPYGNQNNNWNGNSGSGNNYGNAMNNRDFNMLMASLKNSKTRDNDRVPMITVAAKNSNFTSQQIYNMINTMDYDNLKYEVAVLLYPKCVDRQNFHIVYDVFTFDTSRNKLTDFIRKYK